MISPFLSPSPDSTDNIAFFSTSKLQISIVGPTKYNNITVWWYVLEFFSVKMSGIFIHYLLLI